MVVARGESVLLEREAELAVLRHACGKAAAGNGRAVVVRGPAGLGKTTLLAAAGQEAVAAGLGVLSARGSELERELGFGVVRQLFERPVRALGDDRRRDVMVGAAGLAAPVLLEPDSSPPRPEAVFAAMHGLYWLAVEFAARSPLLLLVDDAQWADAPSLRWLAYLGRRLDGVPLLLVITARDAELGIEDPLLEEALSEAPVRVLRPQPLSEGAVLTWLAEAYGREPAAEFVRACWRATGGNPFLLTELVAELRGERLGCDELAAARIERVAPGTIGRALLARLARLGRDAVAVAEAVAILDHDARLSRVAALAGVALDETAAIADRLTAAGILRPGEPLTFAHPILRGAVHEQIPSVRRGLWHARAARELLENGAQPDRIAAHLLLAPESGHAWAASALRSAGTAAMARGAPDAAVPLLRRALAETRHDRDELLLELATAEALAQDPAAVTHARELAAAGETASHRVRGALLGGDALLSQGRGEEAFEQLALAERDVAVLDVNLRQELVAKSLATSTFMSALGLEERLAALDVDALAGDTGAERLLLALRAMDLGIRARPKREGLSIARRVIARENLSHPSYAFSPVAAAIWLAVADELDEARDALGAVIEGARKRGAVLDLAYGWSERAEVEFRAGRLDQAEADARQALGVALEHTLWSAPLALGWLVEVLVEREPPPAAIKVIAESGIDISKLPPIHAKALLLHARGRMRAVASDLMGAVDDFRASGHATLGWGNVNPALPWRSSLALALHARGETGEAQRLVAGELALARQFGAARAIGVALRARALLASDDNAIAGLREAVEILADSPARLEHARALVDLGAALRRAGRRVEAREKLRVGLDMGHRCGAHRLTDRALEELGAAGARPRRERLSGPDALTASERRVAELAADGLTNREIAQALFVTTKTIETHLAHVYAKLDISRRAELAGVLRRPRDPLSSGDQGLRRSRQASAHRRTRADTKDQGVLPDASSP